MNWSRFIGRSLGLQDVESIEQVSLTFGEAWAQRGPAWLLFGAIIFVIASILFYTRYQQRGHAGTRIALGITRGLLLTLIFLCLADPVITFKLISHPRPLLWLLFDGTDSMAIEDELSDEDRKPLEVAAGMAPAAKPSESTATTTIPSVRPSRQGYVQGWLKRDQNNLLQQLQEKYRVKAFRFDRADGVQALEATGETAEALDAAKLAEQLTTTGQVSALGKSLEDLAARHASSHLAGLVVVSDFDQNSGPAPLAPAKRLGIPIFTVGVGPEAAVDISVDLQAPLLMKKAERATLTAVVRSTGLKGQSVTVRLTARKLGVAENAVEQTIPIGEKTITLEEQLQPVEFPFEPTETGRFIFTAAIDPQSAEVVQQNNRAEREANIRDDFLRLMFVEYEPTWEWRFIKEVFHRDPLVGIRGFRTYLRSADPKVRQTNELFLPTLTPPRSEFFANDVIFLGDLPQSALSTRFCEMVKEFVGTFGGGLVILSGPRFGPGQLAGTPLGEMLPVIVDPDGRARDQREFQLELTPEASQYDFMQLGGSTAEHQKAWRNLGQLPWYQPVQRMSPFGTILAAHPTDKTVDQKSPQPLIAVRKYGKGEVIYVAFNESWRLRRRYGELYFRQFWGQMIHRLGLSHALGSQKRFVVRTDRQQYQADDKVQLTVEAFDANFEPLGEENFPAQRLTAELFRPGKNADGTDQTQPLTISALREGLFEARIPVFDGGEYRVRVTDPITKEPTEAFFQVTSLSAERRSAVRNVSLQNQIAATTGGRSYSLATADQLLKDFQPQQRVESSLQVISLWDTWLCFGLVLALMFGEWLLRKRLNLA